MTAWETFSTPGSPRRPDAGLQRQWRIGRAWTTSGVLAGESRVSGVANANGANLRHRERPFNARSSVRSTDLDEFRRSAAVPNGEGEPRQVDQSNRQEQQRNTQPQTAALPRGSSSANALGEWLV